MKLQKNMNKENSETAFQTSTRIPKKQEIHPVK